MYEQNPFPPDALICPADLIFNKIQFNKNLDQSVGVVTGEAEIRAKIVEMLQKTQLDGRAQIS
ncbi:MAG: hypothetical protein OSB34_07765, partial [Planktomarina sp.]|nr:hypothetical protein [Planktomarina sp.]